MADLAIRPFHIDVPAEDLAELRDRITRTRWPDELPDARWEYGIPLDYTRDLAQYWATEYDWRVHEARLNSFPQFTTNIDGADVHFLHVRSPHEDAVPMLLMHGWPGSIVEFVDLIEPLITGHPAFHVVVPSLPGFGFSGPTTGPGWDASRMGAAIVELMTRLGYRRFAAHGGDWGAMIIDKIGAASPESLIGSHLTWLPSAVPWHGVADEVLAGLTDAERETIDAARERAERNEREEFGYQSIQRTRPQTLAYALTDSPVGQLAWIAEKFSVWIDANSAISRDTLLTNVSIYWFTRTAGSSARLYYEDRHHRGRHDARRLSTVPTAVAVFPHDLGIAVRQLAMSTNTIARWTQMPRGGHFAGLEQPELLIDDIRAFFRDVFQQSG